MNTHKTYEEGWQNGYDKAMKDAREALKPVKKTEKHDTYIVSLVNLDIDSKPLLDKSLSITPTTANKLSEAISALVEYVQNGEAQWGNVESKVWDAKQSFQESQ
jgi:hypothetical protein